MLKTCSCPEWLTRKLVDLNTIARGGAVVGEPHYMIVQQGTKLLNTGELEARVWVLYLVDSPCLYPLPATPFYPLFGAFLAQILLKFLGNSAEALRSKAQSDGSYFATVSVPLPNFPV